MDATRLANVALALADQAEEVSDILRALANANRLQLLCLLAQHEEMSVGALVETVGLGQSATSQHLAKLREEGIVATRRDAQSIFYRIADPRVTDLMRTLYDLFCAPALGSKEAT